MKDRPVFSGRGWMRTTRSASGWTCRYYSFLGEMLFEESDPTIKGAKQKIRKLRDEYNLQLQEAEKNHRIPAGRKWRLRDVKP